MTLKDCRSIFIGESLFSKEMLTTLLEAHFNVVAIFGKPMRIDIDDSVDLFALAHQHLIPYFYALNVSDYMEIIKEYKPDVIYCLGWRQIIKMDILSLCPVIGFHPTPLPKGRGHHPLIWPLILEWKWTASTFFVMDAGVDSGDILSQSMIKIDEQETVKTLYRKVIETAKMQILDLDLDKRIPQDHSQATYFRKRHKGEETEWLEY